MEELYFDEGCPWASQKFKLREHFELYTRYLAETVYKDEGSVSEKETEVQKVAHMMGIDEQTCQSLSEMCSTDLLNCGSISEENPEPTLLKRSKGAYSEEDVLLNKATLTLATAAELVSLKRNPMRLKYQLRIRELKQNAFPLFAREPNPSPTFHVPENFVVTARIFKPFYKNSLVHSMPYAQDFLLLGSQTLTSFRDRIECLNDGLSVGNADTSDDQRVPMKDYIKAGMFFFGETFYSDFRDNTNLDYSAPIREWMKSNPYFKNSVKTLKLEQMEDAVVADLEIRLGFPYVYIHLGHCEHIVVFLDARLMVPDDPQDPGVYPLVENVGTSLLYCFACDTYASKWFVEDLSIPTCVAYLCQSCYETYYKGRRRPKSTWMIPSGPVDGSARPDPPAGPAH